MLVGLGLSILATAQESPQYVITKSVLDSNIPVDLIFVQTFDHIYTPIGVRKPPGDGPFPAVIMASGNGDGAMPEVERAVARHSRFMEEFVRAGYVAVYSQYRNEVPEAYNELPPARDIGDSRGTRGPIIKSSPSLDSDDFISIIEYVKALPYVDPEAIGIIGSSHGGELILKAATQIDFAAGILGEPAAREILNIDISGEPQDGPLQFQRKNRVAGLANKAVAMERLRKIDTPILFMGRASDHNQGLFELTYDWLIEAGKDVTWASFDHPRHGYVFIRNQRDGSYQPDETQQEALEVMMEFLGRHLKHSRN